jgi:hypothetical protein
MINISKSYIQGFSVKFIFLRNMQIYVEFHYTIRHRIQKLVCSLDKVASLYGFYPNTKQQTTI